MPLITGKFPLPLAENPETLPLLPTAVHAKVEAPTPLVQVTAVVGAPEHIACAKTTLVTLGVGLMVTTKLLGIPAQPLYVGATLIVPTIGTLVLFAGAFHDGIFPVPLAPKPIFVFEFDQANVEPTGTLAKAVGEIAAPGQTVIA